MPLVNEPGVRLRLGLADHDAADRGDAGEGVDVVVVEGVDAAGVALAGDLVDPADLGQRVVEAVVPVGGQQRRELLAREPVVRADLVLLDDDEACGRRRCRSPRRPPAWGPAGPPWRRCGCRRRPTSPARAGPSARGWRGGRPRPASWASIASYTRSSMSRLPSAEHPEPWSDVFDEPGVAGGVGDVGGLVDHHGRVAAADAEGGLARAVGRPDHGGAARGERQVAAGHQLLGERDGRLVDALEDVGRRALADHHLAQEADDLVRGPPGAGVRARRSRRPGPRRRRWRCPAA